MAETSINRFKDKNDDENAIVAIDDKNEAVTPLTAEEKTAGDLPTPPKEPTENEENQTNDESKK